MAEFGVLGLGVMGSNLAWNIEDRNVSLAVWNLEPEMTEELLLGDDPDGRALLRELAGTLEVAGDAPVALDEARVAPDDEHRAVAGGLARRLPTAGTDEIRRLFVGHAGQSAGEYDRRAFQNLRVDVGPAHAFFLAFFFAAGAGRELGAIFLATLLRVFRAVFFFDEPAIFLPEDLSSPS